MLVETKNTDQIRIKIFKILLSIKRIIAKSGIAAIGLTVANMMSVFLMIFGFDAIDLSGLFDGFDLSGLDSLDGLDGLSGDIGGDIGGDIK